MVEMLEKALTSLMDDECFHLSERAERARLCAERVLKFVTENRRLVVEFYDWLITSLESCFSHPRKVKFHTLRERIWERYFKLRASSQFKQAWVDFLKKNIGFDACPIFYQYVTNHIMETLLKKHFPVETSEIDKEGNTSLDFEESSALRYTAGYVIRSLMKKLKRSGKHDELILCLREMAEGDDKAELESKEWTQLLDRGGLIHVSDVTYTVFQKMELTFQQNFTILNSNEKRKEIILEKITTSDELLFYWSLVSVNWGESESTELLRTIAEHWITVRGFSSASAFIELYKKENKKSVQKSKALRKGLATE